MGWAGGGSGSERVEIIGSVRIRPDLAAFRTEPVIVCREHGREKLV